LQQQGTLERTSKLEKTYAWPKTPPILAPSTYDDPSKQTAKSNDRIFGIL